MSWDLEPEQLLTGRKVLIVEDQYLIADDLCELVEGLGGQVLGPSSRVGSALAAVRAARPHLALLDVNLDEEPVYPVAAALREAGIPFLFITGYDAIVIDSRFSEVPHLTKPLSKGLLAAAVRRVLANPAEPIPENQATP